jgi:ribosomal protein S18 acetylase RimI-like enzyme
MNFDRKTVKLPEKRLMAKHQIPRDIVLRHDIRPGDIGLVVYLHGLLFAEEHGFGDTFEAQVAASLAEFYLSFKPDKERLWVAEKNGQIVGSVGVVESSQSQARLRWLLVDPANRGLGLGKALLEEAIDFCKQCGYRSVFLETFSELTAAGRLYELAGFKITEEKTKSLFGKTVTEQQYVLDL